MASIIKGKIRQSPSGLCSVVFSHVPCESRSLKACRSYSSVSLLRLACGIFLCAAAYQCHNAGFLSDIPSWQSFQSSAKTEIDEKCDRDLLGEVAGRGGLGRKEKMSWKTSVNLRERMAASELEYGVENSWFLTVTQPSVDVRAYEALARYSSYAMDRLNREFNRYFQGQKFSRCSVWEYQDRGSLHCHILISSDCIHAMSINDFRLHICKVWYSILRSISIRFESEPFLSSYGNEWSLGELKNLKNDDGGYIFVDCQQVERSIVAYLSSYLSDSNHGDDNLSKNDKREKFYPIATWCQWNREATRLYEKYNEVFELGECEPDRKKELINIEESLHFDILKKIPLARGTDIKKPQNPFNEGLYFIPAKPQKQSLAKLLYKYIDKLSHIFKSELRREIPENIDDEIVVEWTGYDLYQSLKGRFKRAAKKLFFVGNSACYIREEMLRLSYEQSNRIALIREHFSCKYPIQMELDYGL